MSLRAETVRAFLFRSTSTRLSVASVFGLWLLPCLIAAWTVGSGVGWPFGLSVLGMVALDVVVVGAVLLVRLARSRWRRLRSGWWMAVVVLAAFGGGIAGLVQVRGTDDQRCVDTDTMTVVAPSFCQPVLSGDDNWYYGGTGAVVGNTASDGSFYAPGTGDGSDGGSGNVGDDGDDGGDGGGDGGGGDG